MKSKKLGKTVTVKITEKYMDNHGNLVSESLLSNNAEEPGLGLEYDNRPRGAKSSSNGFGEQIEFISGFMT